MLHYKYLEPFEQEEFFFMGAHCFVRGNQCFLLSDVGTSLIIDASLVVEIEAKEVSDNLSFKLYQRGFALAYNKPRFPERTFEIRPTLFMIDFTTKCNCNCIYCLRHFEDVGDSISLEMLDRITDYIISYCHTHGVRNISFQPWGGEPLIELEKILHCKARFNRAGICADFVVQTNGLLLTMENYRKLHSNGIHVGVSMDGIPEVHDAHRLDVWGNKTHRRVVDNLKKIFEAYPDCGIGTLSVNSTYSIDNISQDIDFIVNTLGISNIKFNLVHPSGGCDFDESLLIQKGQLSEYIRRVLNAVIEQLENGKRCYESNIADKLCNLLGIPKNNMCNSLGCQGGVTFISFDRDGNIYPCEMIGHEDMKLGNVSDGLDLIDLIVQAHDANPYYAPRKVAGCSGCPFFYFCRGGCKACSLAYGKKAEDVDDIECEINKALYPMLIELILENPSLAEKLIDYQYQIC